MHLVLSSCPPDAADALADALVGERLAACCSQLPGLSSTYWWEGQLHRERETLLLFKTSAAALEGLVERLQALHPYEVPEILVLPVERAAAAYAAWVERETAR